jgi:putative isomerase
MVLWRVQLETGIFLSRYPNLADIYGDLGLALKFLTSDEAPVIPGPCKPFLAQMALRASLTLNDFHWLESYYLPLQENLQYWEQNKKSGSGLFVWSNSWDSGVDNSYLVSNSRPNTTAGVDLQAYIYREYQAMASIATKLDRQEDAIYYLQQAENLRRLVTQKMWSEDDGFFYDVETTQDLQIKNPTWVGFTALWAQMASPAQAKIILEKHLMNKQEFWSNNGVRTISRKDIHYNPQFGYWNGPVWVLSNYISMHALLNYGYKSQALDLAQKTVTLLNRDFAKSNGMNECYNPETGAPVANANFISWNLLAPHMVEEALTGLDPTSVNYR